MNIISNVLKSSLGKKYIMAVTGCALFLFVVGHLAGTSRSSRPRGHQSLRLLSAVQPRADLARAAGPAGHGGTAHLVATKLSLENRAARPVEYEVYQPLGSSYASRTMLMGGASSSCSLSTTCCITPRSYSSST